MFAPTGQRALCTFEDALEHSTRPEGCQGPSPVEWLRLASIMLGPCFATRRDEVPTIPLAAPIPPYSLRLAMQQIQHVFTLHAPRSSGKNMLVKQFRKASGTERSAQRLRIFADTVHHASRGLEFPHDVWLEPAVMSSLLAWRATLDLQAWATAAEISRLVAGSTAISSQRVASWHLATQGYASSRVNQPIASQR